jgi:hypothetical protein
VTCTPCSQPPPLPNRAHDSVTTALTAESVEARYRYSFRNTLLTRPSFLALLFRFFGYGACRALIHYSFTDLASRICIVNVQGVCLVPLAVYTLISLLQLVFVHVFPCNSLASLNTIGCHYLLYCMSVYRVYGSRSMAGGPLNGITCTQIACNGLREVARFPDIQEPWNCLR